MSRDKKSNYYDEGGIQVIDVIKAKLTPEQYTGYLLGNVIKYSCRLNFKGSPQRDSEKLKNYSAWLKNEIPTHADGVKKLNIEPLEFSDCSDCSGCNRDYIANIERSKHHG